MPQPPLHARHDATHASGVALARGGVPVFHSVRIEVREPQVKEGKGVP
jgi:hypothetical protein